MGRIIRYKCPFCDKRMERKNLVSHIDKDHEELLPEGFSPLRYVFHYVNKRPMDYHGICTECKGETPWDENIGRYKRQCENPACKKQFVKKFEDNMIRTIGVSRISATEEGLKKLLAGRKISGKYKFQNGKEKEYCGSYEKKALEFMDGVLNIDPDDLLAPGPTLKYELDGKTRYYITDFYYQPYNLIIEVKDGGDNPNTKGAMREVRRKQMAKEKFVIEKTDYNYLRLTNNDFSQLLSVFMDLKMQLVDGSKDRVVHVNESMNCLNTGYIPGFDNRRVFVLNYYQNNVFNPDEIRGLAIANSPLLTDILYRDSLGKLTKAPEDFLKNFKYDIFAVEKDHKELNEQLAPYMGEFIDEEFLYEVLFGKEMLSQDQIYTEELATPVPSMRQLLKIHESVVENYLRGDVPEDDYVTEADGTMTGLRTNNKVIISENDPLFRVVYNSEMGTEDFVKKTLNVISNMKGD